jgi:hypothetical protein
MGCYSSSPPLIATYDSSQAKEWYLQVRGDRHWQLPVGNLLAYTGNDAPVWSNKTVQ